MIRINQIKFVNNLETSMTSDELYRALKRKSAKLLHIDEKQISDLEIIRHSIDARKKPEIYDVYMVDIKLSGISEEKTLKKCRDKNVSIIDEVKYSFIQQVTNRSLRGAPIKVTDDNKRIVVIGAGPAGLFCGYMLAKHGYRPLILERGADVDTRTEAVEHFWKTGELNTTTNVQFGEGGAGTFSDGKLNTMVKDKDGRGREALSIFVENGAPENILFDAKPHIGTDILRLVVKNMRNRILKWGGDVRFNAKVTGFEFDEENRITAVIVSGNSEAEEKLKCDAAVLAIGHSARDTFYMLRDSNVSMEKKPFAVGFRVEHPQSLINLSQYGIADPKSLPPAPYKLTTTTDAGRGVYSFCMCPGGYVVNASSEEGRLAVNGMSYSDRSGENANSAIIVTVDPKDFGGEDVLSGVEFQRRLEEKAYAVGNGKIPVERYGDFREKIAATEEKNDRENYDTDFFDGFKPQMRGDYVFAPVHEILPAELNMCFVQGMEKFGAMIKGYNAPNAMVSGVESRTSSPVRIQRNENGESVNVKGLYPCGEGAGYAGGIMSAAMDGMKIAECIAANCYNELS